MRSTSDALYSAQDLAARYGISVSSVRNWVKSGKLPQPDVHEGRKFFWHARTLSQTIPVVTTGNHKARGAFYTPSALAHAMVNRALMARQNLRVIEPSAGDGAFCAPLAQAKRVSHVSAIELDPSTAGTLRDRFSDRTKVQVINDDFLHTSIQADAIIGNPPFVRLRTLAPSQREYAYNALGHAGLPEDPSGSYWLPFVAHSLQALTSGGILSLILPWESTHVRYARPMWRALGNQFGYVSVSRIARRVFPKLGQDIIILECRDYRNSTDTVRMQCYSTIEDFANNIVDCSTDIKITSIENGAREFTRALLGSSLRDELDDIYDRHSSPISNFASFHIGYVCGDKEFFHPDADTIARYQLPQPSLVRAAQNSAALRDIGLFTSQCTDNDYLWLPDDLSDPGDARYAELGKQTGVADGYKCRTRDPWWRVPSVETPDLILSAFASDPILVMNDAKCVVTNSLLAGRMRGGSAHDFVLRWYSALTRLSVEINVHSLGGGVLVMIPGEVARLRIPSDRPNETSIDKLDSLLRSRDIDGAYRIADEDLTKRIGQNNLDRVWEAIYKLRAWRDPSVK